MSTLKRGTRITYRYAGGAVVQGKIIKPYAKNPDWYLCELTDEFGTHRGGCHREQLTVVDNRVAR